MNLCCGWPEGVRKEKKKKKETLFLIFPRSHLSLITFLISGQRETAEPKLQ